MNFQLASSLSHKAPEQIHLFRAQLILQVVCGKIPARVVERRLCRKHAKVPRLHCVRLRKLARAERTGLRWCKDCIVFSPKVARPYQQACISDKAKLDGVNVYHNKARAEMYVPMGLVMPQSLDSRI